MSIVMNHIHHANRCETGKGPEGLVYQAPTSASQCFGVFSFGGHCEASIKQAIFRIIQSKTRD